MNSDVMSVFVLRDELEGFSHDEFAPGVLNDRTCLAKLLCRRGEEEEDEERGVALSGHPRPCTCRLGPPVLPFSIVLVGIYQDVIDQFCR